MTPEQFCYWLQGRAELDAAPPTPEQWQSIREHLATVFQKVTPPVQSQKYCLKFRPSPGDWGMPEYLPREVDGRPKVIC